MPLLRRQPFIRVRPPPDTKPDDYVFYCKVSGEVFTDYEKFFERIILCNSLVWTCAYTGRSGLTFEEALDSEKKAKEQLEQFPHYLQRPLLCVASLTHRSRLVDMNDDVFLFAKDRYFIDEAVEVVINSQRKSATIVEVLAPAQVAVGSENAAAGGDVLLYRYVVRVIGQTATSIVDACRVGRRRGVLTRDRCKLFLKKHCHCDVDGIWRVKAKYAKQFKVDEAQFEVVCGGHTPSFGISVAKKKPTAQIESDSEAANSVSSDENDEDRAIREAKEASKRRKSEQKAEAQKERKSQKEAVVSREQKPVKESPSQKALIKEKKRQDRLMARQAKKDELKRKADEDRAKKKEEREKLKEEKRRQEEKLREWNKIREDLECEDLKDLPKPVAIQAAIPAEAVGDALCVLEFLSCFKAVFDFDLPDNLSFGTLAEAVNSNEIDGMYYDIVCQLLEAIFRMQEMEETETSEDDGKQLLDVDGAHNIDAVTGSCRELVKAATVASQWPVLNFGLPLRKFQVDSYTVSELVRLHLLGSGFERLQVTARFDYQQRGGYDSVDDPALDFRRRDMTVLKTLSETSIFNLPSVEKLKILSVLMNQLLTFASCRDYIDESAEKLKQVQRSLRAHQYAEIKRERDEAQFWWRKRMEKSIQDEEKSADESSFVCNGSSIPADVEEVRVESKEEKRKGPRQKKVHLTDKDYEEMPTENLDWEKISAEEKERMKDWARRKEKELVEQASELQFSTAICPLGRDRTYRRYWIFRSIPGLFVEDDEQHVSDDCFQPCEQIVSEVAVDSSDTSDVNTMDTDQVPENSAHAENDSENQTPKEDTLVPSAVTVHEQISARNSCLWSLFVVSDDVERLVSALNPRGVRESALKQIISDQSSQISDFISRCDVDVFCGHEPTPELSAESQKVADQQLEKSLREALLDLEERIFTGNLGNLKVTSRMDWRAAVKESRYDPLCATLILLGTQIDVLRSSDTPMSETDESSEPICTDNGTELKTPKSNIRELAMALMQIEQMVEPKYLNPPLGENEETKKQKQKALIDAAFKVKTENSENNSNGAVDGSEESGDEGSMASIDIESRVKRQRTALERWEESLMLSTSLSQLWVHCSVLESSVAWSKSSLHAYCRICRRKTDGEHMLLCDACDRGHHMYCLKPPVKTIPEGDWFCPSCRPKELLLRTPRKSFTELSSDEESESEDEMTRESIVSEMEIQDDTVASMSATETEDYPATADEDDEPKNEQLSSRVRLPGGGKKSASTSRASSVSAELPKSAGRGKRSSIDTSVTYNRRPMKAVPAATATSTSVNGDSATDDGSTSQVTAGRGRRSAGNNREQRKSRTAITPTATTETIKRKISSEWNDYELDTKRMSLTTKSRYSLAENSLKVCEDLVTELMHQDDAWPFLKPVTRKEAVDYFDVIKQPMDFARIRNKINRFEYNAAEEILDDIRLIFSNCFTYNKPTTVVAIAGGELERYFERRIRELSLDAAKSGKGSKSSAVTNGRQRKRTTL